MLSFDPFDPSSAEEALKAMGLKLHTSENGVTCPTCGCKGAYVGFVEVECVNDSCIHYSQKLFNERATFLLEGI